jgi:hypothetical protein
MCDRFKYTERSIVTCTLSLKLCSVCLSHSFPPCPSWYSYHLSCSDIILQPNSIYPASHPAEWSQGNYYPMCVCFSICLHICTHTRASSCFCRSMLWTCPAIFSFMIWQSYLSFIYNTFVLLYLHSMMTNLHVYSLTTSWAFGVFATPIQQMSGSWFDFGSENKKFAFPKSWKIMWWLWGSPPRSSPVSFREYVLPMGAHSLVVRSLKLSRLTILTG